MSKKLKELKEKLTLKRGEYDTIWDADEGGNWEGFLEKTKDVREEMSRLSYEVALLEPIKYEDIPEYGDLMTLEHFKDCCDAGGFIDYDGSGNYALKDKMSNKSVSPSDIKKGRYRDKEEFTHIVWFNR